MPFLRVCEVAFSSTQRAKTTLWGPEREKSHLRTFAQDTATLVLPQSARASLPFFLSTSVRQRRAIFGNSLRWERRLRPSGYSISKNSENSGHPALIRQELRAVKPNSTAANRRCSALGAAQKGPGDYRADAVRRVEIGRSCSMDICAVSIAPAAPSRANSGLYCPFRAFLSEPSYKARNRKRNTIPVVPQFEQPNGRSAEYVLSNAASPSL
jgi:hypothetical protein